MFHFVTLAIIILVEENAEIACKEQDQLLPSQYFLLVMYCTTAYVFTYYLTSESTFLQIPHPAYVNILHIFSFL